MRGADDSATTLLLESREDDVESQAKRSQPASCRRRSDHQAPLWKAEPSMDVGGRAGAAPAGSSKGHEAASHDPNFPVGGLDIQPSHDRFGVRQRHQQQGPGPGHAGASGGRVHQSGSSASASVGSEQKAPESGSDHEQGEPWACDSKADIETYGIAGRIWCVTSSGVRGSKRLAATRREGAEVY